MIKKILAMLLFCLGTYSFGQTGVTVTYYDGTTQDFNVTTAGKLYFESDNLNLKPDAVSTPTTIPVNIIRKITFSTSLATPVFGENSDNLVLYPNPGMSTIRIKSDKSEGLETRIYSLTGQLVHNGRYHADQDIDVSHLASGLYLVQVNGVTIKFSKK